MAILGGGAAGLAAGYFARKRKLPFAVYEAREEVGGNALTFEHGGFRLDSGAHRFHGDDPQVATELRELLGNELIRSDAPGRIYYRGAFIDFPIAPLDVLRKLGPVTALAAAAGWVAARLGRRGGDASFRGLAVRGHGDPIARRFLLNYTEKLWGLPAERLSPRVSGGRFGGPPLAGRFHGPRPGRGGACRLHPRYGYGTIVERLAAACGEHRIVRNASVTRLVHDGRRIVALEISGVGTVEPSTVISTIPLGVLVHRLDPRPAPALLEAARALRFRNVLLVAFLLRKGRVTENASVYFPDPSVPMTRVCEPKNRSPLMAPPGRTSLVAEVPCDPEGELWSLTDREVVGLVQPCLERIGWLSPSEVIEAPVHRLARAYPVLPLGIERKVGLLLDHLARFENLRLTGRSGRHEYTHLHDQLRAGREIVDAEALARASSWRRPARLASRPFPGPVGLHPANPP